MRPLIFAGILLASPVYAEVPKVVTDIPPVHSLVAYVMNGAGAPQILLKSGADPHSAALRPSQAAALQEADVVIWVGPDLTPWLEQAVSALAGDALSLELLEHPDTHLLEARLDEHDEHKHDHSHDPHAWLDPVNAQLWVKAIAEMLAKADPDNAALYFGNAERAATEFGTLERELDAKFVGVKDLPFVVLHDAYQYFEQRFGLNRIGALTASDAAAAGPARTQEVKSLVAEQNVKCVFADTGTSARKLSLLSADQTVRTSMLDPLGASIPTGPEHYAQTLGEMAEAIVACLAP